MRVCVFFCSVVVTSQKTESKPKLSTHCGVDLFHLFYDRYLFCNLNLGRIFSKNAWHVNSLCLCILLFAHFFLYACILSNRVCVCVSVVSTVVAVPTKK